MLEKMFTTKMSMDIKKLQTRFSNIRSKNGKISKLIAMVVFAFIIVSIISVSVLFAANKPEVKTDSILYQNEKMNIQFEIPEKWSDKYIVDETAINNGNIAVKHKRIAEKHGGMGTLFSIIKLPDSEIDELVNMVGNMAVIWRNQEYGYIFAKPTDVQVPVFAGSDKEDIKLAEEYQRMYKDVSYIESTACLISDPYLKEVFFHEATPAEAMIEKGEDGWYRVPQTITASFPWFEVGNKHYPSSVTAYFTEPGTQMDSYKKQIGRIKPPYLYRTMAQVLSMKLQFPNNAPKGHLWFVFEFEDGSNETSEIYNILPDFAVGEGNTETFIYNGLKLDVSNVLKKKKQTASDGFDIWEYDVFVVSKGAQILIKDADMFYDENKKIHSSWAFYTDDNERINIVNGMNLIDITSDILGIYNTESSVYVLMFETAY